jgi:hypothetical protein
MPLKRSNRGPSLKIDVCLAGKDGLATTHILLLSRGPA